jgi:transposase
MQKLIESGDVAGALDAVLGVIGALRGDNLRMGVRIANMARLLYGRRSERLSKDELQQLMLAFGASEEQAALDNPDIPSAPADDALRDDGDDAATGDGGPEEKPPKKRNHPGRTRLSDKLKRKIVETTVPADERACSHCGLEMSGIGHQEHERIEYVPAQIIVHLERREKLGCKGCRGDAVTAERNEPLPIVGRVDVSVPAHLVESKCEDALPIHRQADQFKRLGWEVPTNTLYGYWNFGVDLLEPVAHVVQSKVLGGYVTGIDDTRVDFLDEADNGKRRRGHLWAFANVGGMIAYSFTQTWEAEEVAPFIHAADGFIQVDDYKGYASQVLDPDGNLVTLVPEERRLGCGMHIRRRFEKALRQGDKRAAVPMKHFADLYAVERKARELSPEERLALRKKDSLPVLAKLEAWLTKHEAGFRPSETIEEARRYASQQLGFFKLCFTDGRFEIDNGDVERGMRRIAIGRRNWLFAGASTGAPRLAVAYTLVESCRRLGIPTNEYLRDVMTKVHAGWPMRRIGELTPDAWGIERGLLPSP